MKVCWNVLLLKDVWQAEIRTAETLVPEASAVEFQAATEKFEQMKIASPDHVPEELIRTGGRKINFELHELIGIR